MIFFSKNFNWQSNCDFYWPIFAWNFFRCNFETNFAQFSFKFYVNCTKKVSKKKHCPISKIVAKPFHYKLSLPWDWRSFRVGVAPKETFSATVLFIANAAMRQTKIVLIYSSTFFTAKKQRNVTRYFAIS